MSDDFLEAIDDLGTINDLKETINKDILKSILLLLFQREYLFVQKIAEKHDKFKKRTEKVPKKDIKNNKLYQNIIIKLVLEQLEEKDKNVIYKEIIEKWEEEYKEILEVLDKYDNQTILQNINELKNNEEISKISIEELEISLKYKFPTLDTTSIIKEFQKKEKKIKKEKKEGVLKEKLEEETKVSTNKAVKSIEIESIKKEYEEKINQLNNSILKLVKKRDEYKSNLENLERDFQNLDKKVKEICEQLKVEDLDSLKNFNREYTNKIALLTRQNEELKRKYKELLDLPLWKAIRKETAYSDVIKELEESNKNLADMFGALDDDGEEKYNLENVWNEMLNKEREIVINSINVINNKNLKELVKSDQIYIKKLRDLRRDLFLRAYITKKLEIILLSMEIDYLSK